MLFFTSDTHFNHANIINLGEGRPFKDIEEHNYMLINNWNSVVSWNDTVIHLGDVALGPWPIGLDMVKRLSGRKILIPGNHDRISSVEKPARRERFMPDYAAVFDEIWREVSSLELKDGTPVLLSHYPYEGDNADGREDRFSQHRATDQGKVLIHGHTHAPNAVSRSKQGSLQISVGVDSNEWTPVSEDQIIQKLRAL